MVVNPKFVVGILIMSFIVSEIQVFPVSAAISGCRSLLESPRDILFELAVVENRRFTVQIFMMSVILSEI